MRTVIRKAVQISIQVDIEVEYDNHAREANIVSASIPAGTVLSARSIHESLSRGDYKSIDKDARQNIIQNFIASCAGIEREKAEGYTRSVPCNPKEWRDIMSKVHRHLPITSGMEAIADRLQVLIEPVFGKKLTMYLWPISPTDLLVERAADFEKQLPSLNNPEMSFTDDNTVLIQWNY